MSYLHVNQSVIPVNHYVIPFHQSAIPVNQYVIPVHKFAIPICQSVCHTCQSLCHTCPSVCHTCQSICDACPSVCHTYLSIIMSYLSINVSYPSISMSYLSIDADSTCEHGDHADAMLPDHLPEVGNSVRQWRLCRYVPELITADFHLSTDIITTIHSNYINILSALNYGFTSHSTPNSSFRRCSSQPISWLSTEKLNLKQQKQTCIRTKNINHIK